MKSFRLLTFFFICSLLAACQPGTAQTLSTPTSAVLPTVASVTPTHTPQPTPTQTPTPLPQYPFDPGPTPEFDPESNQWYVIDQQNQKWMLDAAINIWGKPGEAVISNGQLFIWDQQTPAFVDSGIPATSGERVAVSNGKSLWAAYSEVSGHQELAAVVLSTGEVVGAQGGLVKQGDQILRFNGEAKELEQIDLLAGVIGEYVDSTWTAEQQADGALVVADAIGPRWEYTTNEGWRPVPDFVIRYTPDEIRNVFASEDELKTHMPYLNEQILKDWEGGYNGRVNYGAAGQNFDTLKDGRLQLSLRLPYSPENTLVAKVSNTFYLGVPVRLGPRWGYDNIDYVNTVLWVRSEVSYGTGIEETLDWWQKMDELVTTGDRSIIVRAGLRVQPETVERDLLYDLFIELGRPITALTGDWIEKALALGNWLFDGFAFAYYL